MKKSKILIINGPNLNLLLKRNNKIYGNFSLEEIKNICHEIARKLDVDLSFEQSNYEGAIVEMIHKYLNDIDGLIINAAAYTHTSIAIRDALEMTNALKIELHISNVFKREEFRKTSFISDVVDGVISGLGPIGYRISIQAIVDMIKENQSN